MDNMIVITKIVGKEHNYIICEDENMKFWSFLQEHVVDGKLTKTYNGIEGLMSESSAECIQRTLMRDSFERVQREHPEFTPLDVVLYHMKQEGVS